MMALLTALAVFMLLPPGAMAVLRALPGGRVVSYQPLRTATPARTRFDTAFGNVDYNGGPVMPSNTDYLIFWSPGGNSAYPGSGTPPEYVTGIEQYFKDLQADSGGHQNADSVSAQYNDATGAFARYAVTFGGAKLDTDAFPASQCPVGGPIMHCMTDAQLQSELEHFASARGLKRDLSHEIFLLLPPGVAVCFDDKRSGPGGAFGGCSAGAPQNGVFCSYHSNTTVSPMLIYTAGPFETGNPGCDDGNHPNGPSDGAIEGGLSHEHNESITDPIASDAWTSGGGASHGTEVGDQCDAEMGPPLGTFNGAEYNQVINGDFYWYQEEWSNDGHRCLQRYTPPAVLPKAAFTAAFGGGSAIRFNADASTGPGGISDFDWQFNAVRDAAATEKTTPTISYAFPASGAYSTALTVFTSTGLSIGAGGIVRTGHSGFTPGFTFLPAKPTAGVRVSFTGLSTVSRRRVRVYFWQFGDGSTSSRATPTHTYAKAGTYRVTLVMFSGLGSAFPGAGAAPVSERTITIR